uniref:STAS domain-containing protein n=1 Tax=Chromera velia CCMP2878 TaxID=1169474 RepID=A0A0G4I4V5_9ALVE|eukprot:Cvel_10985.t1-p1 / transcript=Cvel_10985.t1 / gene=Cvel_10985 / organism=Chromera_velia_CCMP2878 / gene_product=Putative sulfate transporter YvdB, putative / transcript_product=Putative sulfate transporter YvdB, putative / location=Cvel_scaffold676:31407-39134(-) / protein_length=1013 / sequence_SO=supercontig / SO=protein_coding / is_pseudo=false
MVAEGEGSIQQQRSVSVAASFLEGSRLGDRDESGEAVTVDPSLENHTGEGGIVCVCHLRPGTRKIPVTPTEAEHEGIGACLSRYFWWFVIEIPGNLKAGITTGLVQIPSVMALGISSGTNPVPGLLSAFWGGLGRDSLGSSKMAIMGPSGSFVGPLAQIAGKLGPSILPWIALFSGCVMSLLWVTGIVDFLLYTPSASIHGFALGVALTLFFYETDYALGLSEDRLQHQSNDTIMKFIESIIAAFSGKARVFDFCLFTLCFVATLLMAIKLPSFPGPMVTAAFGILIGWLSHDHNVFPESWGKLYTLKDKFKGEHAIKMEIFTLPVWDPEWNNADTVTMIASVSLTVALIAVLEGLISAKVVTFLSGTGHSRKRELLGLAAGNLLSGVAGGVPSTAKLSITSLNLRSGARSQASSLVCGGFSIGVAYLTLPVFSYLPFAVVGALVMTVAAKMVNYQILGRFRREEPLSLWIALVTAFLMVVANSLIGLIVGALLALLLHVMKSSGGFVEIQLNAGQTMLALVDTEELDRPKPRKLHRAIGTVMNFPSAWRHCQRPDAPPEQGMHGGTQGDREGEGGDVETGAGRETGERTSIGSTSGFTNTQANKSPWESEAAGHRDLGSPLLGSPPGNGRTVTLPEDPSAVGEAERAQPPLGPVINLPLVVQVDGGPRDPRFAPTAAFLRGTFAGSDEDRQSVEGDNVGQTLGATGRRISRGGVSLPPQEVELADANCIVYRFTADLTYLCANAHLHRTERLLLGCPPGTLKAVILVLRTVSLIDLDGADCLRDMCTSFESQGAQVWLAGVLNSTALNVLRRQSWFLKMEETGRVKDSWVEALVTVFPDPPFFGSFGSVHGMHSPSARPTGLFPFPSVDGYAQRRGGGLNGGMRGGDGPEGEGESPDSVAATFQLVEENGERGDQSASHRAAQENHDNSRPAGQGRGFSGLLDQRPPGVGEEAATGTGLTTNANGAGGGTGRRETSGQTGPGLPSVSSQGNLQDRKFVVRPRGHSKSRGPGL